MSGRLVVPTLSVVLSVGLAAAPPLRAQSAVAVDAGVATLGDGRDAIALFESGVRFSSLKPGHLGADFRIATFPQALTAGVFAFGADLDAVLVIPLGERVYATPRAGVSVIGGVSGAGAGGVPGVNYGFGLVARMNDPLALRIDYSHFFYPGDPAVGASSFSVGITWVH